MLTSQLAVSGYCLVNPSFAFSHLYTTTGCLLKPDEQDKPQCAKEIWKTKTNTAWDVTFIQQQNFNTVLVVKEGEREGGGEIFSCGCTKRVRDRRETRKVLQAKKGTNPIIHQHLEESHPQLLLHKSRLSPINPMNMLLPHN